MWQSRVPSSASSRPLSHDEEAAGRIDFSSSEDENTNDVNSARKRKRTPVQKTSCELCKARKVKCDRAEPACSWCARNGRNCVYKERQKPGAAFPLGYGRELDAKIDRLDALVQSLGRRVEEHILDHVTDFPLSVTSGGQPSSQITVPYQQSDVGELEQSSITQDTPTFAGPFWPGEDVGNDPRQVPSAEDLRMADPSPVQALTNPPRLERSTSNTTMFPMRMRDDSSAMPLPDLPSHDLLYTLADLYFKHVNTWCPILDRKTIFGTFFGSTSLAEADRVLLHAIVATTLRFCPDPRLTPELKAHYHRVSRRVVQLYGLEHVTVEALRALVILCLDDVGTSNGPRTWSMLAVVVQNVRQLNLCAENGVHLALTPGVGSDELPRTGSVRRVAMAQPDSWIEDEGRRRLCWMVYTLDRYATIATPAFDFMLSDGEMDRFLPCSYDLFSRNVPVETRPSRSSSSWSDDWGYLSSTKAGTDTADTLGSFSYHCEILRILSHVHAFLRTPTAKDATAVAAWHITYRRHDAALNAWLGSLPGEYGRISALCHSDPASRVANWLMLHGVFVISVVRLHSAAAYPYPHPQGHRGYVAVRNGCGGDGVSEVNGGCPRAAAFRLEQEDLQQTAIQRCLTAVQSLHDIARDVRDADGLDLLGPAFAFALWVAARLLLVHAAATADDGTADPKIDFFVEILGYMGRYWEVADNYAKILARVVLRGRRREMSFRSMRRCAYDLVEVHSTRRRSGLEPTSIRLTSLSELDYVDVFDFFNYPKPQGGDPAFAT